MAYTPRSGRSQTRYSTPEPDLDDHRNQPESLPIVNEPYHGRRRGTLASIASAERPYVDPEAAQQRLRPTMDQLDLPQMSHYSSIARDFENAVDDAKSIKSNKSTGSAASNLSTEDPNGARSPNVGKRTTFKRATQNRHRDTRNEANDTASDRSTSPPNSVDAFAAPRARGRAGTANSKAPSVENLNVHRAASNATHSRRRGTFGEENGTICGRTDAASCRSSVQEDVCFPPEDIGNTYKIDFEDLEEFVAETHTKTPVAHPFAQSYLDRQTRGRQSLDAEYVLHGKNAVDPDQEFDKEKEEDESSEEELARVPSKLEMQNRFTFFSSEIDESIHAPELGGLLMPDETFRDLFELNPEGGVWWLDMLNPSEEEISAICRAFRIHNLTREDITTQETREKVELFRQYYFLCFRSFNAIDPESKDYLEPINVYAVVFGEGILTFSFCQNQHAVNVRKRISKLRDHVNLSADWLCYALIDEIIDGFGPEIDELERKTVAIEDSVFQARVDVEDNRAIIRQLGECRRRATALTRLLDGKADVIRGFAKKCNDSYSVAPRGDVGLYLSDVQDHVVTMMSKLGHFEKMLSRSHSNHIAQVQLNHIEQGSRANELLGKITVLATILVPLNLVAGLFGMNVPVPGKNSTGLGWWFGIVGVIFGFSALCILVAKKYKFWVGDDHRSAGYESLAADGHRPGWWKRFTTGLGAKLQRTPRA